MLSQPWRALHKRILCNVPLDRQCIRYCPYKAIAALFSDKLPGYTKQLMLSRLPPNMFWRKHYRVFSTDLGQDRCVHLGYIGCSLGAAVYMHMYQGSCRYSCLVGHQLVGGFPGTLPHHKWLPSCMAVYTCTSEASYVAALCGPEHGVSMNVYTIACHSIMRILCYILSSG